jgi:hypothetical protein
MQGVSIITQIKVCSLKFLEPGSPHPLLCHLVLLEDLHANRVQQVRYDSLVSGDPCGIVWIVDDVCYFLSASTILIFLGSAWDYVHFPDRWHNLRPPRHEVLMH